MSHGVLGTLIFILSMTVLSVTFLRRLGLGTVFGFLAAGILVGPAGFGLIHTSSTIEHLGEFGILFMLFIIGLDIRPSSLSAMRKTVFGLGGTEVFMMGTIFSVIASVLGVPFEQSLLIGLALSLSSTALDMQILSERNEINTQYGRTSFGILLFQDLMAVPLLALIPLLAMGTGNAGMSFGTGALEAIMLLGLVYLSGKYLVSPFLRAIAKSKSSEAFTVSAIILVLLSCWAMDVVGLPLSLGAFLAGMMLSESEYKHQIQSDVMPFKALLLGLFFMTVGMEIDFALFNGNFETVMKLVGGLMLLKIIFIYLITRYFGGLDSRDAFKTGFLLGQAGEFALVIFKIAGSSAYNVLPQDLGQMLILTVLISMLLTPLIVQFVLWLDTRGKIFHENIGAFPEKELPISDHVIIAGFGRVGQTVACLLDKAGVPYTAIDLEPDRVAEGREAGLPVFYGDATRYDVLRTVGANRADMAVIALDNVSMVKKTVQAFRENFPDIKIFARARNHMESEALQSHGVTGTVPETTESSLQLGRVILSETGMEKDRIYHLLSDMRHNDYEKLHHIVWKTNTKIKAPAKKASERHKKIHDALLMSMKGHLALKNKMPKPALKITEPKKVVMEKEIKVEEPKKEVVEKAPVKKEVVKKSAPKKKLVKNTPVKKVTPKKVLKKKPVIKGKK